MSGVYDSFLALLSAALTGEKPQDPELEGAEWDQLLRLAAEQEILPLVYDNSFGLSSFKAMDWSVRRAWQRKSLAIAMRQIIQTNERRRNGAGLFAA